MATFCTSFEQLGTIESTRMYSFTAVCISRIIATCLNTIPPNRRYVGSHGLEGLSLEKTDFLPNVVFSTLSPPVVEGTRRKSCVGLLVCFRTYGSWWGERKQLNVPPVRGYACVTLHVNTVLQASHFVSIKVRCYTVYYRDVLFCGLVMHLVDSWLLWRASLSRPFIEIHAKIISKVIFYEYVPLYKYNLRYACNLLNRVVGSVLHKRVWHIIVHISSWFSVS
mmetsp:Transcript_54256/g.96457  ORF Transcript_54256/g.96457 Transcript_54256/m.96457 type:complete len:223 (+) Transcript_54256:837-1505(+)